MKLRYFIEEEFRGWYEQINPILLKLLDIYRMHLHKRIIISPAEGAIGRNDNSESQHNINKWGKVNAIDIMPVNENGVGLSIPQLKQAFILARSLGFTGIGVYPDWKPYPGLHLDVREDKVIGKPAAWAGINKNNKQIYVTINEIFKNE